MNVNAALRKEKVEIKLKQWLEMQDFRCEWCGKSFVPTHKDQKYCRMSHYREARRGY